MAGAIVDTEALGVPLLELDDCKEFGTKENLVSQLLRLDGVGVDCEVDVEANDD